MRIRNASRLVVDGDVEWKLSLVRPRVISAADYSGFATENRKKEGGGERGKRKFVTFPRLDATLGLIKRKTSALFLCGLFWDAPSLLFEGRDDNRGKRERKKGDDSHDRGTKLFADDSREFFNSSILWTTFFAKLLPEQLSYLSIQFFVIAINVYRWSSGLYHYIKIYF